MAETSGFFNAHVVNGEHDRVYLAEQFAKYFASFIGNGIFGGKLSELMVVQHADGGMKVTVLPGMGWINGFWYENSTNYTIDVAVSDGVASRIDNIVVRWGKLERKIWIDIVTGTPATNAVAPVIVRSSEYYELKLAEIHVNAGLVSITQENIVDTRLDNEVCGLVAGVVDQIDTTEYVKQLNSFVSDYIAEFRAFLEGLELTSSEEINDLIDRLESLIEDESALASLAFQIDDAASEVALASQTLGYTKKNLIPYPYTDTTKETNGIKWTNNNDGSITANGTATEDSYFFLYKSDLILLPGKYIVTSNVNDSSKQYFAYALLTDKASGLGVKDAFRSYDTIPFEITESDIQSCNVIFGLSVLKGVTVSNLIFKPMIRRAEILDSAWEPYKLSVVEMIREDETEKGCFYRLNQKTKIKEWINPPSKLGIEYCTIERRNGNPVYQKTFYAASLPNNSVMSIITDTMWDRIVSVEGYALNNDDLTYYPFPVVLDKSVVPAAVISAIEYDGALVIHTTQDMSAFRAYVTVKYTKQ